MILPIKGEATGVYFGTPDGKILGELGSVSFVELEAEAAHYVTDVPAFSQMGFSGSFKIEINNERKMHGKPLMRGRKGIGTLLRKALKLRKRRNRRKYGRV